MKINQRESSVALKLPCLNKIWFKHVLLDLTKKQKLKNIKNYNMDLKYVALKIKSKILMRNLLICY